MGFALCCFLPPVTEYSTHPKLLQDPKSVVKDAKTVILLLMPYRPARAEDCCEAVISNYYPVSHEAYKRAKVLSGLLLREGFSAVSNVQLPLKKLLLDFGLGDMGLNSLIAIPKLGSAFHVQAIVTNAQFEYTHVAQKGIPSAQRCKNCLRCVSACPTGAIRGDFSIEVQKCLRAVSETDPIPEAYEALIGNRLLGCDLCQSVCPANALLTQAEPFSYPLKRLLRGDIEELKQAIGPNLARTRRMQKKAAVLTANLKRYDLKDELIALCRTDDEGVARAAKRALKRLEESECK